ncbi:MAG: YggS family pyridoxal phosphate-dependent enzyme [Clostridiales bacterium]|jgi:pyridoxal phosphate enzyme (YggS family)|nr:YggS family pyridoxal phosphate-dependent enzyme [Clostridiales bacterium]HOA84542.1 YggS family pyridoxal phosphate-dependent enzyme [Bacillota bacterium]
MDYSYLKANVERVRERIKKAAEAAGRNPDEIMLLAAVKYADSGEINYLHQHCGIDHIGENRVQQLMERWESLDRCGLNVHFIGSLQRNKVKYIADKVSMIHSLDSEKLAAEIDRQAAKHNRMIDVLVEINSGYEENKGGVLPEEAETLCRSLSQYPHIRLRGFMTMGPVCAGYEEYCKYFRATYDLIVDIWEKKLHNIERPFISMGMSESIEAAVACGSTCVRVGRILFEKPDTT